jgi:branched-chain amino acid transport system substrate-binding protein
MARLAQCFAMVILAPVFLGCTPSQSKEPIHLAHLFPQTGPDRDQGRQAQQAALLAVEEINQDEKAVLGRPLAVHNFDTRGEVETAQGETVRALSLQRVAAVIAGPDAGIAEQVIRTAHPYTTTVVVAGELADPPTGDGVVALGVDPRKRGQFLARYAAQELKAKRAVVLTEKRNPPEKPPEKDTANLAPRADNRNTVGHRVAAGFFDDWPRAAPASAEEWQVADFTTDKDLAKRLVDAKPDVVLVCSSTPDFVRLRSQCAAAKCPATLIYGGADMGLRPFQGLPPGPDVCLATVFAADALSDKGKAFAKKYEEHFHEPPDLAAIQAYDAVRLVAEAMQRINSASAEDLRRELSKIDRFESLLGTLVWKDHAARRRVFVVRFHDKETTVAKTFGPDD